jgi:hypothetical protein
MEVPLAQVIFAAAPQRVYPALQPANASHKPVFPTPGIRWGGRGPRDLGATMLSVIAADQDASGLYTPSLCAHPENGAEHFTLDANAVAPVGRPKLGVIRRFHRLSTPGANR